MPLCASVYLCLVVTYLEWADLLALVLWCITLMQHFASHWGGSFEYLGYMVEKKRYIHSYRGLGYAGH